MPTISGAICILTQIVGLGGLSIHRAKSSVETENYILRKVFLTLRYWMAMQYVSLALTFLRRDPYCKFYDNL